MKKFLKLFGLAFITFAVAFNVNAAGVCDHNSATVRKIENVTPYRKTGWDAWAYICRYTDCEERFTACDKDDYSSAEKWCAGEYQAGGYKQYDHTVRTGNCAKQNICTCSTCTATCTVTTVVTTHHTQTNCNPAVYKDCTCVSTKGPVLPEDDMVCTRKYTTTSTSTETKTFQESFGGEDCASTSDYSKLRAEAKKNAEAQCTSLSGSSTSGNTTTTVTGTVSGTTTCKLNYRVRYDACKCAPQPYLIKNVMEAEYQVLNEAKNDYIPAYCIHPEEDSPTWSHVDAIDATQCESSNSTQNCGFANILIEGYYRSIILGNDEYDYSVIGAAIRLWSAHVGQGRFSDTGVADEDATTIGNINSWLKFVPGPDINGPYLNVFRETLNYFSKGGGYRSSSVSTIYEVDTITNDGISNLNYVACSQNRMGVFCTGDVGNTNRYLYALSLFANTVQGNKDMQLHLNAANFQNNPTVLDVIKNDPMSYSTTILSDTKVQISYKLRENVEIDCSTLPDELKNADACKINQQAIVKDKNGHVLGTANITEYDYCRKNYCYVTVEFTPGVLNCNVIDKFVLKTDRYVSCGANSVKKYFACSNPGTHQVMFSFEPDNNCTSDVKTTEEIESTFKCNLCEDDAKADVKACDSTTPVTNSVSDPSLNCILHKTSGSSSNTGTKTPKHAYDYSDTFKVNTDICRVYCSDKVNYIVSGRKSVANSFQLRYDIKGDLGISNNDSNKLVSMIEMQRDCVSEIFYDEPFDYVKDWSKAYDLSNVEIDNWQDLYNALAEKSKDENERTELLNKLAYDLYNCNFYPDIVGATGGKVRIPLDAVNSYDVARKLLQNTVQYCNDNDCVSGYIKYDGGAEFIHPVSEEEQRVGSSERNPYLTSYTDINTSSINVKYCDKGECFRQINGKYSEEDFSAAHSSRLSSSNVSVLDVKVPTNDYAIFSIKVTNNVYNPVLYQVQHGTGKVQVEKEADKDKYYTLTKNTFPVSSYAYTLCEYTKGNMYASCKVNHQYFIPVYAEFKNSVGAKQLLFSRNYTDDNFLEKLEEANKYSCDYTVKPLDEDGQECPPNTDCGREGYIFRNIDLGNPVPVERDGTNWDATNSSDPVYSNYVSGIINEIKDSDDNNLYATDYYLEYSFVLDSTAIEEIRSNNKVSNYFALPNSCKLIRDKNDPLYNTYTECKSSFLNDVRTSHKYSIIVNKGDGVSQYTEDKNKIGGAS